MRIVVLQCHGRKKQIHLKFWCHSLRSFDAINLFELIQSYTFTLLI